jgi:excisionase family DNA binding protein
MNTETDQSDEWWTPSELAIRWKYSVDTIKRLIKSKKLRAMSIGPGHRIHRDEIARFEAEGKPPVEQRVSRVVSGPPTHGPLAAGIRKLNASKARQAALLASRRG